MKKSYVYVLCIFAVTCFFVSVYLAAYNYSLKHEASSPRLYESDQNANSKEDRALVNMESNTLLKSAFCVLEEFNATSNEQRTRKLPVPFEFVGMSRKDLEQYFQTYNKNLSGQANLYLHYELLSFSPSQVVLRKTYRTADDDTYRFWLKEEDGHLVVFRADGTTIYLRTGITLKDLDFGQQVDLKQGKYIQSVQELYDYLESCTS